MSVLSAENISVHYPAFSLDVSFELDGQVTGIFGPSGAGKTTMLEIISGLRKPNRGRIQLQGKLLLDRQAGHFIKPQDRHIGYVPQDLALFPHKTVRQNLLFGSRSNLDEFEHVVKQFQLESLLDRYPHEVSGGEKQRIAIGRALITQPRLLMLDEPLSNLDRSMKIRGLDLFKRVRDEFSIPILYVAHDPNELVELCQEVIVLVNGKIEAKGLPTKIFKESSRVNYVYEQSGAS
jgi:molybdate transport system ATP-binding protein